MQSPDEMLVYLHCSSIFTGSNAQVRKLKKVTQLLSKHMASIGALTDIFTTNDIAAVAKKLLEEGVFESLPQAKRRFPGIFQQTEAEEATKKASEAEVTRIEAEEANEGIPTSDEETDSDYDGTCAYLRRRPSEEPGRGARQVIHSVNVGKHGQSNLMPKLHSFYLPFKTQHKILTVVQTILEECCFDFGKTWVPRLMKAQKWDEPESIELTKWIKIFSKHTKDLPTSATRSIAGKSLKQVLFDPSSLRHAAVHRLPTTAAEIVNMLRAAHSFTTALNDPMRAIEIERIKVQLSLVVADLNAGLRCDSYVSSFYDQMAKFECEISAQNHEEDAGDFRNAKYERVFDDRLDLFPAAEDEVDLSKSQRYTENHLRLNTSEHGTGQGCEISGWWCSCDVAPVLEEACEKAVAHTAEVFDAAPGGHTRAGHGTVPETVPITRPPMFASSSPSSSRPRDFRDMDAKEAPKEAQIRTPELELLTDTDVFEPLVSLISSTGTAILDRARAAYARCVAEDAEWPAKWVE